MENNVFASSEVAAVPQQRGLQKTAELNQHAMAITRDILKAILRDESYRESILASQRSNDDMDTLINTAGNITDGDLAFLQGVSKEEIEKMLKSQQSKRSRLKAKTMTLENYTKLMTAGVAELILRTAGNIPKGNYGSERKLTIGYTADELNKLVEDQEALARAIRNVQSKKCIAKGKAGFDPQSEEYQEILRTEDQLKALRKPGGGVSSELVDKAKKVDELKELLPSEEQISNMSNKDVKALLARIASQVAGE